jgi:alpha-tubulin suppressor-like RCC1 family protein
MGGYDFTPVGGEGGLGDGGETSTVNEGPVDAISVGYWHACATVHQSVHCWGANSEGQLGNGSTVDSDTPVDVQGLGSGVVAISTGYFHACALVGGEVWCWGLNQHGQLGTGTLQSSSVPVRVEALGSNVTAISAGGNHTCATVNGAAYCWGYNALAQVGDGTRVDRLTPVPVVGLSAGVTALDAGEYQTCAVHGGTVVCWGQNAGAVHSDLTPAEVADTGGTYAVTTGGNLTCALRKDDALGGDGGSSGRSASEPICWGTGQYGALGDGQGKSSATPVALFGLTSADQISAGPEFGCAIAHGAAYCWGSNIWAAVGDGTVAERDVPTPVSGLGSGVTAISAGGESHNCAIAHGQVYCWGTGSWKTGTLVPQLVPLDP